MLRVHLFGRPRLLLDEIALPLAGRPKVVPLLAYLLLHRGAALPRQAVANALWPDEPEDDARANLRRHLNYLQHVLPPPAADRPWIVARGGQLRFAPDCALWLDVAEFERLAALPHRRRDAVALYAGDLLGDFDEEWLEPERERLRALYRETLAALVASLRAAREYVPAIAAAQRLLRHDPWREDTLRTLMLLRYEAGDRAGALAEYERFAQTLRAELGTEPMPETTAAYASVVRDAGAAQSDGPASGSHGAPGSPGSHDAPEGAPAALPFVGRDVELAALVERWEAAAAGRGGLVLVGGEAGIGKTRLAHELAAGCEARGGIVYAAAATFPEAVPYQPFAALLGAAAPLLDAVAVDPAWLGALVALAPALRGAGRELPPLAVLEPERERLRLFEAAANVFEALGKRRPLVLVVEDLHWAGPATLALLEHLARRFARARVLLIATYREDELELGHRLRALRRRLEREGAARHVALGRLPRAAVDELLRALADDGASPAVARVLHERSEGNPFFLDELVRGLVETGSLRIAGRRWTFDPSATVGVPRAVREAVAARVARLGERASALVEVAATVGRGFDVELLRETTGWPEASVLDALGELLDRRIVSERGRLGYAFTHHLLQAVVYDGIAPPARVRRHRRVAHVLSELYAEQGAELAAELALHWDRGGEPELAALQYLAAARRALAVYGNEEAHAHLSRALALSAAPRLRFDALLLRERVEAAAGEREAQRRDCAELAALARALGDDDAACTVLERRIELANVTSDRRRERVLLALLRRRARRWGDAGWRIRALGAEARYSRVVNDFAGARRAFGAVIALAERSGDRGAHVAARLAVADSYIYEGRLPEAQAALRELRAAVDLDGSRSALVRTLMAFARAALVAQDYETMSRLATEAHDVSRAIGDREGEALALHTLANGLLYTPRVDEARAHYRAALALYERIHHRVGIASISVDYGLFHTELGQLDDALAFFARAREVSAEIGFRFVACVNQVNASYCRRLRGDLPEAKAAAESALQLARGIRSQPLESAALGVLGAAESELGAHADAVAHLRAAVELRRPAGATPRLGD
ncbi:MAG: hypothetical protein QOI11_1559, partial [Candidatus Eremiobacteraeota bacterium]|nr:hypothetical protein [Candidatus Eremiobacteraeota bacterium]